MIPEPLTEMLDPCNWKKYCTGCDQWFLIEIQPPGTKLRSNLPQVCPECEKARNAHYEAKKDIPREYTKPLIRPIKKSKYKWYSIED